MELDMELITNCFRTESEESLAQMEQALVQLETHADDPELLNDIFRVAHTLKGNASGLGYGSLASFAHVLEDLLDHIREGTIDVSSSLISLLLKAVDALRVLVPEAIAGKDELHPKHKTLMKELSKALKGRTKKVAKDEAVDEQVPGSLPSTEQASAERARTLRVDTAKLDRMLNVTGEIAIARGRLRQLLEDLEGGPAKAALEAHLEADQLYMDLQEQVMKIRMVPIGPVFRQYARLVRDLASTHGKQVRLVTEGEDVELDTTVLESMRDPLMHMIRNSVDHGIETPQQRRTMGKSPCGVVLLKAFREGGDVVIQFKDDGAGFNRGKILERAKAMGKASAEKLSDSQLFALVFEAGFSTAEAVTDLSGRGVGMDVVRKNIEALRGTIEIESRESEGTTFTIRLPLTLAIIDGFGVSVGEHNYIIPLESVVECQELPPEERERDEESGLINLRGEILPYLRLRHFFDAGTKASPRENVVVVQHEQGKAGLVVDALQGERQTVVKPLGRLFQRVPGVSGSAILGNGRVALILEVAGLLKNAIAQAQ